VHRMASSSNSTWRAAPRQRVVAATKHFIGQSRRLFTRVQQISDKLAGLVKMR
jgi:hypothetical protein